MFEPRGVPVPGSGVRVAPGPVDAATVRGWQQTLTTALEGGTGGLDDAARIELILALEELKCTAEAGQAVATVHLDASHRGQQAAAGGVRRAAGPRGRRPGRDGCWRNLLNQR